MHRSFADWYRAASLEPKAEDLEKLWKGIDAFAAESCATDLAELARIFHGLPARDAGFEERFRTEFKKVDGAFAMEGNALELRVLAGSALVRHFEYDGWAAVAALCIIVPACFGLRRPPVAGIVEAATQDISRQSALLRREAGKPVTIRDLKAELKTIKARLEGNEVSNVAEPLTSVLNQLVTAVGELAAWIQDGEEERRLRREESDVLWWLAGAHSRDLKMPLHELKTPSGCLVVAKELADVTGSLPGPFAAESFLDNALRAAHPDLMTTVGIAEAVMACESEWRKDFASAEGVENVLDLCPVHLAARKCVEAQGKKAWLTPFHSLTGFQATQKVKPLDLTMQTYRERLLVRALRERDEADA